MALHTSSLEQGGAAKILGLRAYVLKSSSATNKINRLNEILNIFTTSLRIFMLIASEISLQFEYFVKGMFFQIFQG